MKPRVYLETSVISYLTGRPSRDLVTAAHQQITREWWDRRGRFDIFVSQAVLTCIGRGVGGAVAHRTRHAPQAAIDAVHVAVAIVNDMDSLLT